MGDDANRASGQLEFHDIMLREMRSGLADVRKDVAGYRDETVRVIQRLDDHIDTCDKRYTECFKRSITPVKASPILPPAPPTPPAPPALFSKHWIAKKAAERLIDYLVFTFILLAVFLLHLAFTNGFHLPNPAN